MSENEIQIIKPELHEVLICTKCTIDYGKHICLDTCDSCFEPFEDGDEIVCDGFEHLHKDCYEFRKEKEVNYDEWKWNNRVNWNKY